MRMLLHLLCRTLTALLFVALLNTQQVWAIDYYVSPTGSNATGDGSQTKPWQTLDFAASKVAPNAGHTIRLTAGTHELTAIAKIPSGVSLIGTGKASTLINCKFFYDFFGTRRAGCDTYHPDADQSAIIQINTTQPITVQGFTLDGQTKKCVAGLLVSYAKNALFEDLGLQHFLISGLWLHETYDTEVRNCSFVDNSWGDSLQSYGALQFNRNDRLKIHDNTITERGTGAYGIKEMAKTPGCAYSNAAPWTENTVDDDIQIYNNRIEVDENGKWNNGSSPAITIEVAGDIEVRNMDIHNNWLNNHISIVSWEKSAPCSYHIHHNYVDMRNDAKTGSRYAYFVEMEQSNMEIDHNIILYGYYPISMFANRLNKNERIHHNVFYAPASGYNNGNTTVFLAQSGYNGYQFYNNTIVDVQGVKTIWSVGYGDDKVPNSSTAIRNNLFMSTFGDRGDILGDAQGVNGTITHNLFYRISPRGTNAVTGDPKLNLTDLSFTLQAGSPAIDAGTAIPGITNDASGNPDIGAFEANVPTWRAGIIASDTQAPTTPVSLTGSVTSTFITLSWKPSYDDNYVVAYDVYQNGNLIGTTKDLTFTAGGLTASTTYSFTVKARDFTGNASAASNTFTAKTTTTDAQAPTTPANLKADNLTDRSATLSWSASTDNEGIGTYLIYRDGTLTDSTSVTTYVATGLFFLNTYAFTVKAKDFVGNVSGSSAALNVKPIEPDLYVTARGENLPNEGVDKIHDGDLTSKWLDVSATSWVQFRYKTPPVKNVYRITSGNDSPERDLKNWTLKGSNDETNWVTLDSRTDQSWPERNQTRRFRFANTTAYKFYRLDITANNGGPLIQVSELAYANEAPDTQAPTVPANVLATNITYSALNLSWTASTDNVGVASYEVLKNGQSIGTVATPSILVTGLSAGITYAFTVRARDEDGNVSALSSALYATTQAPPATGAYLLGAAASNYAPVNLTNEGLTDWINWPGPDRKSTGGSRISNFTLIGGGGLNEFADALRPVYWSDGSPTTAKTDSRSFVWTGGQGNGFSFTAPASTKSSTLKVYVGSWYSGGTLTAKLSDGSGQFTQVIGEQPDRASHEITLNYRAGTDGQKITVTWVQSSGGGNVLTLQGAAFTESPTSVPTVKVAYRNGDNAQPTDNQIKPFLQLTNESTVAVPYQELTARYWLTAENFSPLNVWIDYAQLGNGKVKTRYVPLSQPRQGAYGYIEYSFDASAGNLLAGADSGPIESRIGKADWTPFVETDDYSYGTATSYTATAKITLYRNGTLIWGTEPDAVAPKQVVTVQTENKNQNTGTNTISTYLKITNAGNVPVDYKDLTARYWFTAEGTQSLNYWIDYASLGNNKVRGTFKRLSPTLTNADTYFELAVDSTLGKLYPLSSTGNIQYRLAKADWSVFNETNDYSYKLAAPMADNDRVTVYYKGQLIWGTEPKSGARQGYEHVAEGLTVDVYPNPASSFVIVRQGDSIEPIAVTFQNVGGQTVQQQQTRFNASIPTEQLAPGLYILRIQAEQQIHILKIVKQ